MTVENVDEESIVIFPSSISSNAGSFELFSLPHPSNNQLKGRVKLIEPKEGEIYELKSHCFSKGCLHNTNSDLVNERYHYTANQEPLKSTFLVNETNRKDGKVKESGDFQITTKYDLTFSLIGYYYRESITEDEKDYKKSDPAPGISSSQPQASFFTARDYHDTLIDCHDSQWSNVSLKSLEKALTKIAEPVEEAGTIYFKITPQKITKYLAQKVQKIVSNFPHSIRIPISLPADIAECYKITIASDLLISLIPKKAYSHLQRFSPDSTSQERHIDILDSHRKYNEYKKSVAQAAEEKELLVQAAMTVGLTNGNTTRTSTVKKVRKSTVKVKKQTGRIDGFFKRAA